MTVNCTRVEPGGRGHVETTHKLLCFFIRIRIFVQINLRHIKHKMTRLVWLTKCPHVPQASPSATNTVNWRNSLDILFSLRSLSSWGRPRFITTPPPPPSSAKTLTASNLYLKMLPKSRVNQRSTRFPRSEDRAVISVNILHEQPSSTLERCRFFHQK